MNKHQRKRLRHKIIASRRTGKTTQLMRISAETGAYMAVRNMDFADILHKESIRLGLEMPFPVTYDDVLSHKKSGKKDVKFLIDEAQDFLQYACKGNCEGFSMSID